MHAKERIFGKFASTQSVILSKKINLSNGIFHVICLHLKSPCLKIYIKEKSEFWNWMDIILLKVLRSSFSAVVIGTLNWWLVNLSRNKEEFSDYNTVCFRVQLIKGYMVITE